MKHPTTRGFTLIELLIVVAIIAILAAIAVPNLLEAQTRSKVSRVKADQRTIATAMEAYNVDNKDYPNQAIPTHSTWPYSRDPRKVYGGESERHDVGNPAIAFWLSTPIAYLTDTKSFFKDVFFQGFNKNNTSVINDTRYYNYSGGYYTGRVYDAAQDGDIASFEIRSKALEEKNRWHLRARGPDGDYERRSGGWEDYLQFHGAPGTGSDGTGGSKSIYDPTNGTVSNGDIVRFGTTGVAGR